MGNTKTLIQRVRECKKCPELAENRTQPVLGEGPVPCNIVFVGEAPGRNEDATGTPFCGATGTILETSARLLGLQRKEDYHILNTIKCRPPDNRKPTTSELANCTPFLELQLHAIHPKVAVALGQFAQAFFLKKPYSKVGVVRNMGKIVRARGMYVVLSCHPRFTAAGPEVLQAFRIHIQHAINIAKGVKPKCTALNAF